MLACSHAKLRLCLNSQVRSHRQVCRHTVHYEYPLGALETAKKLSVKQWTLHTLNSRHLGYVAQGEGPPPYYQTCENGGLISTTEEAHVSFSSQASTAGGSQVTIKVSCCDRHFQFIVYCVHRVLHVCELTEVSNFEHSTRWETSCQIAIASMLAC